MTVKAGILGSLAKFSVLLVFFLRFRPTSLDRLSRAFLSLLSCEFLRSRLSAHPGQFLNCQGLFFGHYGRMIAQKKHTCKQGLS
jgi:hypothetical protein